MSTIIYAPVANTNLLYSMDFYNQVGNFCAWYFPCP